MEAAKQDKAQRAHADAFKAIDQEFTHAFLRGDTAALLTNVAGKPRYTLADAVSCMLCDTPNNPLHCLLQFVAGVAENRIQGTAARLTAQALVAMLSSQHAEQMAEILADEFAENVETPREIYLLSQAQQLAVDDHWMGAAA
jgi:hypothetical protein